LAVINAVLRDIATKSDAERIRAEHATKEDAKILRDEISKIRDELSKIRAEYVTKEDVKALRNEIEEIRRDVADVKERIAKLEGVVSQLVERTSDLDKRLDYVAKISWTLTAGVIATLIANIAIMILT